MCSRVVAIKRLFILSFTFYSSEIFLCYVFKDHQQPGRRKAEKAMREREIAM
jgi:hypothetical protein